MYARYTIKDIINATDALQNNMLQKGDEVCFGKTLEEVVTKANEDKHWSTYGTTTRALLDHCSNINYWYAADGIDFIRKYGCHEKPINLGPFAIKKKEDKDIVIHVMEYLATVIGDFCETSKNRSV